MPGRPLRRRRGGDRCRGGPPEAAARLSHYRARAQARPVRVSCFAPGCIHSFFFSPPAWAVQSLSNWPSPRGAEGGRASPVWCWRIHSLRLLRWRQRFVYSWLFRGVAASILTAFDLGRCSRPSDGFRAGSSTSLCAMLGPRSEPSSRERGRAAPTGKICHRCCSWHQTPIRWYRPHKCAVFALRPRALVPFAPGVSSPPPRCGRRHPPGKLASDSVPALPPTRDEKQARYAAPAPTTRCVP